MYVENKAMTSWKKMICSPVCACVHVGKVYWINESIIGRSKEDKKLTLLTYKCMRVCVYICVRNRKFGPFVFSSPHMRFFLIFGNNLSRSSSRQKNIACLFALYSVCDAFCCPSLTLVIEIKPESNSRKLRKVLSPPQDEMECWRTHDHLVFWS